MIIELRKRLIGTRLIRTKRTATLKQQRNALLRGVRRPAIPGGSALRPHR